MVLPAGFAPASVRLEDGCLICSATEAGLGKLAVVAGAAPGCLSPDKRASLLFLITTVKKVVRRPGSAPGRPRGRSGYSRGRVFSVDWHGCPVLPRGRWGLEARLRAGARRKRKKM
jgi:hypothetical protein